MADKFVAPLFGPSLRTADRIRVSLVDRARLNGPRAAASLRRNVARFAAVIGLGVVTGVQATCDACLWLQRVAIPALRDSDAVRYLRRRRPEVALYGGTVACAVAVGWLIALVV